MKKKFLFSSVFKLIILLSINIYSQNETIGSVERLDDDINYYISEKSKIEILAKGFNWSEGPVWSTKLNSLLFSDVPNNIIYKWNESSGLEIFLNDIGYSGIVPNLKKGGTNGLTIDAQGNLIICMHGDRRISKIEDWNSKSIIPLIISFDNKLFNSPNDLIFNSKQELFFTDPPYGLSGDNDSLKELDFNGVYKLKPNGEIKLLIRDLSRPNGIGVSNNDRLLYVANSDKNNPVIMKYELTEDGVKNPKIFFDGKDLVNKDIGLFDGLKVHPSGLVFATGPGGVLLIREDGTHIGTIKTELRSANCSFDEDYEYLYMTSHKYLTRIKLIPTNL